MAPKLDERVLRVARQVRQEIVDLRVFGEGLECGCAVASVRLWTRLREAGYDVRFILGSFAVVGKRTTEYLGEHCWVEVDGYIVDLTVRQFRPGAHRVFVVRAGHASYRGELAGREAIDDVEQAWPREDRPSTYWGDVR